MGTHNFTIDKDLYDLKVSEIKELEAENKRRGDYIIHLLAKQNVVLGLNEQDIEWLKKLGVKLPCDGQAEEVTQ